MGEQRSIILDVYGTNIQAEGARLRAHGPATPVELPGGVCAWAPTPPPAGIAPGTARPRTISTSPAVPAADLTHLHSFLSNGHVGLPVLRRPGG